MTFKKIILLIPVLIFALPSWAQVENKKGNFDWAIENIVLIMGMAAVIGASIALYKSIKTIWMAQNIASLELEGIAHDKAVSLTKKESFVAYIYQQLSGTIPLEQEADILLNHNYDGIQELDNNLPPWWVGMFYGTIIFGFIYIFVFHFSDYGVLQIEEYKQEVRSAEIAIAAFNLKQKEEKEKETAEKTDTKEVLQALTDSDRLAAGEVTFQKYCAACHGKNGEGMVGLGQNLTDKYWIHGGGFENILTTATNGVPSTTMIPWKTSLSEEELKEVASYILTLQGTNPPNAREPEGELWAGGEK